jgi:hypothetical protein
MLYLVKNLLQVCLVAHSFCCMIFKKRQKQAKHNHVSLLLWSSVLYFEYVDAPAYQILKNLNIISTGVLYRIILKKK